MPTEEAETRRELAAHRYGQRLVWTALDAWTARAQTLPGFFPCLPPPTAPEITPWMLPHVLQYLDARNVYYNGTTVRREPYRDGSILADARHAVSLLRDRSGYRKDPPGDLLPDGGDGR